MFLCEETATPSLHCLVPFAGLAVGLMGDGSVCVQTGGLPVPPSESLQFHSSHCPMLLPLKAVRFFLSSLPGGRCLKHGLVAKRTNQWLFSVGVLDAESDLSVLWEVGCGIPRKACGPDSWKGMRVGCPHLKWGKYGTPEGMEFCP